MKKNCIFCLIIVMVFTATRCGSALYVPTQEIADQAGHPLDDLQQGRALYVKKCGACHRLHLPSELSAARWQTQLNKMQVRAKVKDPEKELMLTFLSAGSRK